MNNKNNKDDCTLGEALQKDKKQGLFFGDQTGDKIVDIIGDGDQDQDNKIEEVKDEGIILPKRYVCIHSGNIIEVYENPDNEEELININTDKICTHGIVHDSTIPGKGETLTQILNCYHDEFINNSLTSHIKTQIVENPVWPKDFPEYLKKRSVIVKKIQLITVEATTKIEKKIKEYSKILNTYIKKIANEQGIIIRNTKFKFGFDTDGNLVFVEEILFSDSNVFLKKELFKNGVELETYLNQPVMNYVTLFWEKNPDQNGKKYNDEGFMKYPVKLPNEVIEECSKRYIRMGIIFCM